jgi:hypothetical protein
MQKLEIVEYPVVSMDLFGGFDSIGDVINTENLDDIFGVLQNISEIEINIPEGLLEGKYHHFKGGEYKLIGIAYREKTEESLVIYESLYDSKDYPKGTLWGRPVDDFLGTHKSGVKRFEYIGE